MIAHGNVEFEWVGNILIYKLQGAFNEQGLMLLIKERQERLESKGFSNWLRVVYLYDDASMSQDLFKKSIELEKQSTSDGCDETLYVVPNDSLRRYRQHHEKIIGSSSTYCDSIEAAVAQLKKHTKFISD